MRSFAREPFHRERFADLNERNRDANMKTVHLNAAYFPAVEFIGSLATVLVIVFGGLQVIDGNIEIGVLVGFVAALNGFFDPIGQLTQVYTTYQSGMAALDKIFELLDTEPDLTDAPDATALPPIRGEIELRGVSFRYRRHGEESATKLALDDVSIVVPPGQTVALVGADRRRQVDDGQARRALLRPRERHRARRRPRPARGHRRVAALADRHRAAGGVPVRGHGRRQHRVRPRGRHARGRSRTPRARSAPGTSSADCPTGSTPRSASAASSSPPGSAS